eukprot:gnl/TRDRNA2_/TRDRNA2_187461_c0_seq1.p1 gnl/TRDRNA2_/TRDRNA2_187461_c0~~gnl/TRDRNA2_/TRDRNA2_187461_c0_seq1.p1  ORF type:complete len:231 (+),score=32.34 gnl/TRDRNA2_/TRDRNA2_187461_c0_seq1:65-757(+)
MAPPSVGRSPRPHGKLGATAARTSGSLQGAAESQLKRGRARWAELRPVINPHGKPEELGQAALDGCPKVPLEENGLEGCGLEEHQHRGLVAASTHIINFTLRREGERYSPHEFGALPPRDIPSRNGSAGWSYSPPPDWASPTRCGSRRPGTATMPPMRIMKQQPLVVEPTQEPPWPPHLGYDSGFEEPPALTAFNGWNDSPPPEPIWLTRRPLSYYPGRWLLPAESSDFM